MENKNYNIKEENNLEIDTPELDLDVADAPSEIETVYEDATFKVLHPKSAWGYSLICYGTDWDPEYVRAALSSYIIEEKTGKKRKFKFYNGYGDIYAPSGARYSCATWVANNGTDGLKRWIVSQNFPFITTNLKKKLGSEFLGDTDTYTYPTDADPGYKARVRSTQIKKIKIAKGTESIKDLSGFTNVKKLIIPEGVKRIGRWACGEMIQLEELYLPNTLQRIGDMAFYGSNLKSVFIPKSVKTMGTCVFESDKHYPFRRWNGDIVGEEVDPSVLTIYCEAAEKPSGWDEDWNRCQYLGYNRDIHEDMYSRYHVVWGAARPTMNIEEDLELDAEYPEYNEDNLSMEYVEAILDKYFELENRRNPLSPEEEERRRNNCYKPWGHNINNYFVRQRGEEVLLIGETDEDIGHGINIVNLPKDDFKDAIHYINPKVKLKEEIELEVSKQETDILPYLQGDDSLELIEKYKNEKRWFLVLSDGQYESVSGIDELEGDEVLGGLKTFDEAKIVFLEYDLEEELRVAKEADGTPETGEDSYYYEFHIELHCATELETDADNEEDGDDSPWVESTALVADRHIIEDPRHPENNISEELDLEASNPYLDGYKLSEDQLVDISYLKDKHFGDYIYYHDQRDNKSYDDLYHAWSAYPHNNDDGQWYMFKVKDNDTFFHDYNIKYPYLILYQGYDENQGPEIFKAYLQNGINVGRISQEFFNELNIHDNIPEIDLAKLQNSHSISEDIELDLDVSTPYENKKVYEDEHWKVEIPGNYFGLIELSKGTNWGFAEELNRRLDVEQDGYYHTNNFDPSKSFQMHCYNNYKTYVFTNKDTNEKYIYSSDRFSLPEVEGKRFRGYGYLFNTDGNQIKKTGYSRTGADDLEYWLRGLKDSDGFILWCCKKWKIGLSDLYKDMQSKNIAEKTYNNHVIYPSEQYKEITEHKNFYSREPEPYRYITSVKIKNGVREIKEDAFEDWENLTEVQMTNSVEIIGSSAFSKCPFSNITLSNKLKIIRSWAFSGCHNLNSIILPEGLTTIEKGAFANCPKLTKIFIPKSVTILGDNVFVEYNPELKIYCEAEQYPEGWSKVQPKVYSYKYNENAEQANFIFGAKREELNEDLDLDVAPLDTVDWRAGRNEFINKMKQEAQSVGATIEDIKNMYPQRLDCVWDNGYTIKINDRWSIWVYSSGELDMFEQGREDDWDNHIVDTEGMEETCIFTDNDLYQNVGYEDDKPIQRSDNDSRYCGFVIEDNRFGEDIYSYDIGYEDQYSMKDMPSITKFVTEILPKYLSENDLPLNTDDNGDAIDEDIELDVTDRVSERATKEHTPLTNSQKLIIRDCMEEFFNKQDGDDFTPDWKERSLKYLDDILKTPNLYIDSAWDHWDNEIPEWNCSLCTNDVNGDIMFLYDIPKEVYNELIEVNVIDEEPVGEYEGPIGAF